MSRAFTKERDDAPEPELTLPARTTRYAVTPARYAELEAAHDARARDAVVIQPPADRTLVDFGATVTLVGIGNAPRAYTIVDDDDADVRAGKIGRSSPLAIALIGNPQGATVTWHRPIGDAAVTIEAVAY